MCAESVLGNVGARTLISCVLGVIVWDVVVCVLCLRAMLRDVNPNVKELLNIFKKLLKNLHNDKNALIFAEKF